MKIKKQCIVKHEVSRIFTEFDTYYCIDGTVQDSFTNHLNMCTRNKSICACR